MAWYVASAVLGALTAWWALRARGARSPEKVTFAMLDVELSEECSRWYQLIEGVVKVAPLPIAQEVVRELLDSTLGKYGVREATFVAERGQDGEQPSLVLAGKAVGLEVAYPISSAEHCKGKQSLLSPARANTPSDHEVYVQVNEVSTPVQGRVVVGTTSQSGAPAELVQFLADTSALLMACSQNATESNAGTDSPDEDNYDCAQLLSFLSHDQIDPGREIGTIIVHNWDVLQFSLTYTFQD